MHKNIRVKVVNVANIRVKYIQNFIEKINLIQNIQLKNILPIYIKKVKYPNIYLEGMDIKNSLEVTINSKQVNEEDLLFFFNHVLLEFDSMSLYHGNIKLSNILYNKDGSMAISDYFINDIRLDIPFSIYNSPEVIEEKENNDISSDIWSIGVILYEIFENKPLFSRKNNSSLLLFEQIEMCNNNNNKQINIENKKYEDLINRMLVIDKSKRLTVNEMNLYLINIKNDLIYHYSTVPYIKSFDYDYYYNVIHYLPTHRSIYIY